MFTNKKKSLFTKKIKRAEEEIWDFEFKVFKARKNRETVRIDRDRAVESVGKITEALKTAKGDEKKALEAQLTEYQTLQKTLESKMDSIDYEIYGIQAKNPEESQKGMLDVISGLIELKNMYIEYMAKM